jgi:hypothetical protein
MGTLVKITTGTRDTELNIMGAWHSPTVDITDLKSNIECFTSVDPVKATLVISGWAVMAAPAVGPYPGITFTMPAGKPTCRQGPVLLRQSIITTSSLKLSTVFHFIIATDPEFLTNFLL